jgi:phenylacetate-CoA ligase
METFVSMGSFGAGEGVGQSQPERVTEALRLFFRTELAELLDRNLAQDAGAAAVAHFHSVARDVPAYRQFLAERGVEPARVEREEDFRRLPFTNKQDYYRAYPLPALCRRGALEACDMLALSSGSTGEPAAWPRFVTDELATARRFEQVLHDGFQLERRRTLAVVCFALGSWVGGMYTTACLRHLAAKGYPLTLVTPGNQKTEALRALRVLAPLFEEVVLFGYPPFLKDLADAGRADGFDWRRQPVRLVMAGEVFSEEWRALVCERLGVADPETATASLYGTADGGVLASETPLSVRIRRFLAEHPAAARELFGEARLPTLCQYDPVHRYFEADGGDLVFSGDGGAPLLRYKILDRGGLVPYRRMMEFLAGHGFDPRCSLASAAHGRVREQPFVFVFGRASFALSFYGANVYPENVSVGLEDPVVAGEVTGKFVMRVARDADLNAELEIAVELAPGSSGDADLAPRVARSIRHHLERLNGEFAQYVPAERRAPRVKLLPYADPEHFPPGVKHRYVRP